MTPVYQLLFKHTQQLLLDRYLKVYGFISKYVFFFLQRETTFVTASLEDNTSPQGPNNADQNQTPQTKQKV